MCFSSGGSRGLQPRHGSWGKFGIVWISVPDLFHGHHLRPFGSFFSGFGTLEDPQSLEFMQFQLFYDVPWCSMNLRSVDCVDRWPFDGHLTPGLSQRRGSGVCHLFDADSISAAAPLRLGIVTRSMSHMVESYQEGPEAVPWWTYVYLYIYINTIIYIYTCTCIHRYIR